jgi:glycosyltransferase involved in cell wall biosynthesis
VVATPASVARGTALITSSDPRDISAVQAERRARVWNEVGAIVLAPSAWSARHARESFALRGLELRTFPIPLDLAVLCPPVQPAALRRELGVPADPRVALVRALDPAIAYKGFGILLEALRLLDAQGVAFHVVVVGEQGRIPAGFRHIGFTELGSLSGDAALAKAYQAADFFVSPSTNETGPMMAGEAMACGRPLVAYPVGIAPDLVEPGRNGALAEPVGDVAALAAAIRDHVEMPAAELFARQRAAAASAAEIFSARRFAAEMLKAAALR